MKPTKKNEISKENNKTPQKNNTYLLVQTVQQNPENPGQSQQEESTKKNKISKKLKKNEKIPQKPLTF